MPPLTRPGWKGALRAGGPCPLPCEDRVNVLACGRERAAKRGLVGLRRARGARVLFDRPLAEREAAESLALRTVCKAAVRDLEPLARALGDRERARDVAHVEQQVQIRDGVAEKVRLVRTGTGVVAAQRAGCIAQPVPDRRRARAAPMEQIFVTEHLARAKV